MKYVKILSIFLTLLSVNAYCQNSEISKSTSYAGAYSSNGEIYLTNIEGTSKIKITNPPKSGGGYLAWSPDGKHIAFYAKYDEKKTWSVLSHI